jgi:trimeric autotransporter adhesin
MTINRSTLLDLPLPVTGTEDGTWGDVTNNGLTQYLDIAIAGMVSLTSSDFTLGDLTIALTEGDSSATNIANASAQYSAIKVSSLAQNSTITAPSSNRAYKVINSDSTYSLTIKASGQTGVTFAPGTTGIVAFNGTDYEILGVVGPASATDNAVPKFDGTTGQIIQGSGVTIDDSNNVSGVAQLNATTADLTNIEVTNIKAKDGTSAGSIADSTGVVTLASSVLTTTDINGGSIDAVTLGTNSAVTEAQIDNVNINGNTIVSSDTDGDLNLTPNGTGDLVLDGLKWPQADGSEDYVLSTDGAGQLSWAAQTGGGGGGGTSVTVTQATATAAQTDFSVTYTVGQLSVYLNGALLASADYTASNGTTVVLASGAAANDIFTAVAYSTVAGLDIESGSPFMTAVGSGAGAVNTGVNNVFVGFEAGNDNNSGTDNTALGYQALDANTTSSCNVAIGSNALSAITTAGNNVAVGFNALCATTNDQNTAVGSGAMATNSSGSGNTAVGFCTLQANTTGYQNSAFGCRALGANTTGLLNNAFGSGALRNNETANANNAFGDVVLFCNTTGTANNGMGREAMERNTTGSWNVGIGQEVARFNTTGNYNVAVGAWALHSNTCGCNNIGIGTTAGVTGLSPAGIVNITTECNRIVFGNDLHTCAQIKIAWTATSDCRDKTCFAPIALGLDFVRALKPTEYQFKQGGRDSNATDGKRRYGFLAQEMLPLEGDSPVIISADDPDKLQYTEAHLIPVLVKAIQELTARVEQLENA